MNQSGTMNDSELIRNITEGIYEAFKDKKYDVIGLYIPVFLAALIANILVILVVIKDQYMRNVTNYFLVNLSVADLLVTVICMPNAAWRAYTAIYNFGEYACKITTYLQCVSVASSIFTITAMAIDRYLAITRPFGFFYRCFNKRTTIIVIFILWTTSFLLFSPILVVQTSERIPEIPYIFFNISLNEYMCKENWNNFYTSTSLNMRHIMGVVWFICVFVIPGLVMLFAYSMMSRTLCSVIPAFDNVNESMACSQQRNKMIRSRKRVACILLLLAFVFAGCWLPYHITNLMDDAEGRKRYTKLQIYLLLLGHTNSALNPIIYCALSRKFRRSIKDMMSISIEFKIRRRRPNMQWVDSSGSGTQLNYLHRVKSVPTVHNQLHFTLSRLQSSQKTTKTCAV